MLSRETLVKIRDALTICRGGDKQFVLLAVSKDEGHDNFENIMMRQASNVRSDTDINPVEIEGNYFFDKYIDKI